MTPLGYAMRLVHYEQRNRVLLDRVQVLRVVQALRRDQHDVVMSSADLVLLLFLFASRNRRVEPRGLDLHRVQALFLILHQRDQWRDDEHGAAQEKGGKLKAQGLSRAGRQNAYGILSGQHGFDELALPWPETLDRKS